LGDRVAGQMLSCPEISFFVILQKTNMPARDHLHHIFRESLEIDGWKITHDPYVVPVGKRKIYIDLAAEEDVVIGAEKSGEKIAVEVKTFAGFSEVEDFHNALGQYLLYSFALMRYESEREVFLSIPEDTFEEFLDDYFFFEALEYFMVKFVVFDPINKKILQWERWKNTRQS
jgi:hypothetical protein